MLRQNGWLPLTDRSLERIQNTWGDKFNCIERRWLDAETTNGRYTFTGQNGTEVRSKAVVGVNPNDPSGIERRLQRPNGETGMNDEEDWILFTRRKPFPRKY